MTTNTKTINCLLIRHAATQGNLQRRYIGKRTDEPLCEEGRRTACEKRTLYAEFGKIDALFCSPMLRAKETAAILFPELNAAPVPGLEEIDFGKFEGKNYQELNGDPDYQRWLDSGGTLPFPEGESRERFVSRTFKAFTNALRERKITGRAAFVVHGGTVMAILARLTKDDYFNYQVDPGCGYELALQVDASSNNDARICMASYRRIGDRVYP